MKTWNIGDSCVLGRTSKVIWTVEKILATSSGEQYGLCLVRKSNNKTIKKVIPIWKAIFKQVGA